MTGRRTLTLSHHHATARVPVRSRLADWFRGHGDLPGPDFQDDGDDLTVIMDQLGSDEEKPRQPAPEPWWGMTEMDIPPVHDRPYVPSLPPVIADLGALPLFKAAVHATFVRQEEARGFRAPHVPWYVRYAGLYRARTALPLVEFGIADALQQAHEETKEALAADISSRIDRITAPVSYGHPGSDEDGEEAA